MARPALFIHDKLQVGDVLDVSAPRGSFTLRAGDAPVVFLSAGIGATPVLAMLHVLAAEASAREIWWLYGARDRREHPFAEETDALFKIFGTRPQAHSLQLACARGSARTRFRRSRTFGYGRAPGARAGRAMLTFISAGRAFLSDLTAGLAGWGVAASNIHTEIFGSGPSLTPGIAAVAAPAASPAARGSRHRTAGLVCPERSRGSLGVDVPEPTRARRSVRCPCKMVVSDGSLPHL